MCRAKFEKNTLINGCFDNSIPLSNFDFLQYVVFSKFWIMMIETNVIYVFDLLYVYVVYDIYVVNIAPPCSNCFMLSQWQSLLWMQTSIFQQLF